MDLSATGVFLVGLGAVFGVLPRVLWPPRPDLAIVFGTLTTREDRLRFAVETTGLASAAAGSILLVVADLARWWLELGVVALAALAVWGLAAHKLRQLWLLRLRSAADDPGATPPVASAEQQRELAAPWTRWTWCLRHALARTGPWPPPATEPSESEPLQAASSPLTSVRPFEGTHLERRHISELHAEDARLADLAIPPLVRLDCEALAEQGFVIRVSAELVSAVAPDGRSAAVRRSSVEANSATAVAARALFLKQCEEMGAQLRVGARGQQHVAGGIEWRLPEASAE